MTSKPSQQPSGSPMRAFQDDWPFASKLATRIGAATWAWIEDGKFDSGRERFAVTFEDANGQSVGTYKGMLNGHQMVVYAPGPSRVTPTRRATTTTTATSGEQPRENSNADAPAPLITHIQNLTISTTETKLPEAEAAPSTWTTETLFEHMFMGWSRDGQENPSGAPTGKEITDTTLIDILKEGMEKSRKACLKRPNTTRRLA